MSEGEREVLIISGDWWRNLKPSPFDHLQAMGSFEVSAAGRYIRELGEEYHRRTEAFDQTVCMFTNERGIAIPIERHERRACNVNADRIETELLDRAREDGFPISRAELRRAIQDVAPC